jgi:hypothetical protein
MDKMTIVKYYNPNLDDEVREKTKVVPLVKEDPRKRTKKQNMTVMDNHSFAVEQEPDARDKLVEVLKDVENVKQVSSPTHTPKTDSHLEDLLNKSLNLFKMRNPKDGDLRLNERSKVQGSRDLQSNRIRQKFTNKNIYTKYFNKELDREENKIWWEHRDPIV